MNKVYTQDEFEQRDIEVILTSTQADYTYFAIKLPKRKRLLVYFQHPFDGKYYHINDCVDIMGDNINPCHNAHITNVFNKLDKL